ncbi:unnamed protein product [Calypogeia fissa]
MPNKWPGWDGQLLEGLVRRVRGVHRTAPERGQHPFRPMECRSGEGREAVADHPSRLRVPWKPTAPGRGLNIAVALLPSGMLAEVGLEGEVGDWGELKLWLGPPWKSTSFL